MPVNKGIVLASRPPAGGKATLDNFALFEREIGEPAPGQVLVRNAFLSLDPYMRGRMEELRSYAASQEIGQPMVGGTVGEVVASKNERFAVGDKVVGMGGWQLYSLDDGAMLRKIDLAAIPIQAWLGALGMPGVTAWHGVNKIIAPKRGETLVVSAATGRGGLGGRPAREGGRRASRGHCRRPREMRLRRRGAGLRCLRRSPLGQFRGRSEGRRSPRDRRLVRECRRPMFRRLPAPSQ